MRYTLKRNYNINPKHRNIWFVVTSYMYARANSYSRNGHEYFHKETKKEFKHIIRRDWINIRLLKYDSLILSKKKNETEWNNMNVFRASSAVIRPHINSAYYYDNDDGWWENVRTTNSWAIHETDQIHGVVVHIIRTRANILLLYTFKM